MTSFDVLFLFNVVSTVIFFHLRKYERSKEEPSAIWILLLGFGFYWNAIWVATKSAFMIAAIV
jgi:hypothetical protein